MKTATRNKTAATARAGETNRVTLLVGKSYSVTAARPLRVVGLSAPQVRVRGDGTTSLTICRPVTFRAASGRGGGFAMSVEPSGLGGAFAWSRACCPLTGYGDEFWFACSGGCVCGGCAAEGTIRISKHGHWIERTTEDVIRLDGKKVHGGIHLW